MMGISSEGSTTDGGLIEMISSGRRGGYRVIALSGMELSNQNL